MISGANEEELDIANARADLLLEIQKLKQENEELKEALENKKMCYYNNKAYDIKVLLNKNNILTEFEKWLQDMYNYIGSTDVSKIIREYYFIFNIAEINVMLNTIEFVAHKLQELKEGKK